MPRDYVNPRIQDDASSEAGCKHHPRCCFDRGMGRTCPRPPVCFLLCDTPTHTMQYRKGKRTDVVPVCRACARQATGGEQRKPRPKPKPQSSPWYGRTPAKPKPVTAYDVHERANNSAEWQHWYREHEARVVMLEGRAAVGEPLFQRGARTGTNKEV